MISLIKEKNDAILNYIDNDYNKCLYLYFDYLKYGLNNENIKFWKQTNDKKIVCLILKYHNGMHIFSKQNDLIIEELVNLIKREEPSNICAEKNIIEKISLSLSGYKSEYGWVRALTNLEDKYDFDSVRTVSDRKEFYEIAKLLIQDEMCRSYDFNDLLNQIEIRNKEKYSRNYIIKNEKEIISHAGTGAENKNAAIINYVLTKPEYRGKGYAKKVVGKLCYDLINEGKVVYLVNYSDESTKLYDKLGFKVSASIGKLILKKKNI